MTPAQFEIFRDAAQEILEDVFGKSSSRPSRPDPRNVRRSASASRGLR